MFQRRSRGIAYTDRTIVHRNSAVKVKKSAYLEMRFLIPKQSAELIIGPNGNNIKRLHKEYCAMINISGETTAERILTVGGFDIPNMVAMLQDVIKGLRMALLDQGFHDTDVIGMLLDETEVDYITNTDTYQLNQILEDSGTHIDIFLMCCPQSSDRIIRIRGEPECIVQCISSLYQLLEWCPKSTNRQPYNADNANEEYAADYGGYTDSNNSNQAMDISYGEEESSSEMGGNIGDSDVKSVGDISTAKITARVSIPSSVAGAIIGKGGSRLKHIRHESMANITLDTEMQSPERIISITGTAEQVENAKKLLRLCIQHMCIRIS